MAKAALLEQYSDIWFDKHDYLEAERIFFEKKGSNKFNMTNSSSLANEIAKAREHIKNSLECMDGIANLSLGDSSELVQKLESIKKENESFKKDIKGLQELIKKLENRVASLEKAGGAPAAAPAKPATANGKAKDDDDVDLFGSDSEEESEELKKIKEERLAAYAAKKSKKPVLIAKSNIILDVKPWDDETDMKALEKEVRKIEMDGLLWGASKLAPLAYGIHKLQISCVVEDEKVSVDALQESIQEIEDFVQSVDIAAFNKV